MKKKRRVGKFKVLNRFQKRSILGGFTDKDKDKDKDQDQDQEGGYPPYEPGGSNDKDKDKDKDNLFSLGC